MQGKVEDSYPWGIVRAFAGREFVKYEWRSIPDGSEEEADKLERRGLLELRSSPPAPEPEPDATDAAAELAAEHGIDLASVAGTGVGGRILVSDVEEAIEPIFPGGFEEEE